jgi:hypothetical protein
MVERRRLGEPQPLPASCKPVTGLQWCLPVGGVEYENGVWLSHLTQRVRKNGTTRRIGRDPKEIPAGILEMSGHPPKSATHCIKRYLRDLQIDRDPKQDRGLKRLRELCMACAVTSTEVRQCAIINCPLWAHRLGKNPHNFHRRRNQGNHPPH